MRLWLVTSLNEVTKPPSGSGWPRSSITRPSERRRSEVCADPRACTRDACECALPDHPGRTNRDCVVADQLFDGFAGEHEARRIFEEIQVALIPRHQPHFGVHDADSLRQIVHHGFEQLTIAQLPRGFVEQGDDFRELDSGATQRAGEHQARRGRAERARQIALQRLQQCEVGALRGEHVATQLARTPLQQAPRGRRA